MQSVAQAKFLIATRWMLYSILCRFGVSSTKSLLSWKRIWSRPTKRDSGSLKVFLLEIFRRAHKSLSQWSLSSAPTWIRIWKQKACWVCASVVWVSGLPGLGGLVKGDFRGRMGDGVGKRQGCFSPFFLPPPFHFSLPPFPRKRLILGLAHQSQKGEERGTISATIFPSPPPLPTFRRKEARNRWLSLHVYMPTCFIQSRG